MTTKKATRVPVANNPGIYERTGTTGTVTYQVVFRDDSGKQVWRSFPDLKTAQQAKVRREDAVRTGDYVNDRDRTTVAEYARSYVDSRKHEQRPATRARQLSAVATHIDGTELGAMPLVRVRREHVDTWLATRTVRLADGTQRDVQRSTLRTLASLLRATFAYAVENRRLKTAPAVVLSGKRRSVDEGEVYAPNVAEVRALADAMPTATTRAMVLVQAGAGLRVSELFALRRRDVSTTFRTVKITAQLSRTGERVPCKTDSSVRTVPMSAPLVEVLAGLEGDDDAYLFTSSSGRPFNMQSYGATFKRAARAAGLPESVTSHDLRHHFATTLLRAGLSPVAVGHLLGHTDGSLVVKTYAHWMPEDDDLARVALDSAWGDEQPAAALRAVR